MPKTGAGNRRAKVVRVEGPGPEVGEGQEGRRGGRAQVALGPGEQEGCGVRAEGSGAPPCGPSGSYREGGSPKPPHRLRTWVGAPSLWGKVAAEGSLGPPTHTSHPAHPPTPHLHPIFLSLTTPCWR